MKYFLTGGDLYQWDIGRKVTLALPEGETASVVEFTINNEAEALVVSVVDNVAEIPNKLLQRSGSLRLWAVTIEENGRQTRRYGNLPIFPRAKPDDYVYTETEIMDYRKVAKDLAELVQRVEEIEENGVQGGGAVASVNGKTGEVYLNAADVGALPTTGGKLTGNLTVPRLISTAADADGNIYEVQLYPTANGGLYMPLRHNGAVANAMSMSQSATTFGKPVAISSGGHGGKNAAEGRQNLSLYSKEEIDEKITNTQKEIERLTEEIVELDDSLFSEGYSEEKVNVPTDLAVVVEATMVNVYGYTQAIAAVDLVKYPVSSGQKYYITNVYRNSAALYAFEKANGTVFGAYPTAEPASKVTATDYEIVVPDEAVYLLINDVSRWQSYTYTLQTLAPSVEKTFRAKALLPSYVPSRLYGKKLVACGDSITDGSNPDGGYFNNYAELVAKRHGMVYHKDAIGGSTMTNVEGKNPFCVSRYLNHTDFDYLTIWFGWNDGAYATLGTIEDTEDTTFYGAYKKVLTHYMTTYPTKKIGIVVPYGFRTNIQQAVQEISEMFGVPCLDLADGKRCSLIWGENNEAQIARRAALTYDTTHPNQAGHEFIATMYEQFLLRL